jgi:signal peptidase I
VAHVRLPVHIEHQPGRRPIVTLAPDLAEGLADDPQVAASMRLTPRPNARPRVTIQVAGGMAELRDLELDRDIYYTETSRGPAPALLATGTRPVTIGRDQFFCLGDNSPQSRDSRAWTSVNDWVRYHTRSDDPGAPHGEHRVPIGLVPRTLLIGRAFFVYFPAPYGLSPTSYPLIPNFGDLRFIR